MEKDRINIDKLFRENLSSREVIPSDSDWAEIENALNEKKNKGGFWLWSIALVIVLSACTCIYLFSDSSASDNHSNTVSANAPGAHYNATPSEPLSSNNDTTGHSPDNLIKTEINTSDNNIVSSTQSENIKTSQKPVSNKNRYAFENKSRTESIKGASKQSGLNRNALNQDANLKNIGLPIRSEIPPGEIDNSEFTNEYLEQDNQSIREKSDLINLVDTTTYTYPKKFFPTLRELNLKTGFIRTEPFELERPNTRLPKGDDALTRWSILGSLSSGITSSKIDKTNFNLEKRNDQELPSMHWGIQLGMKYQMGRSGFGLGLEFGRYGENVQYTNEILTRYEYTTAEWQEVKVIETIWDTVWVGQKWYLDSIDVITFDTLLIETNHSYDSLITDNSITERNGTTSIQNISIPIQYQFDVIRFREKATLFLSGSLQMDYALIRKAYYLNTDSNELSDIRSMTSYKTLNSSASLGVGLRLNHSKRLMSTIEIYYRSNLFSWNTDFNHRYNTTGVRLGIGYRL
ncbi:MAG: hypothetical protein ACKVOK_13420 [Flavobacteriales bacterium]